MSAARARLLMVVLCIGSAAPLAGTALPGQITIQTARGLARIPVLVDSIAGPLVPGAPVIAALGGSLQTDTPWLDISLADQSFRFLLGAPVLAFNDQLQPLVGMARVSRDSAYLPLQFLTEILPRVLSDRYAWDRARGRFLDSGPAAVASAPPVAASLAVRRLPNGLLPGHVVTIDPGHGGKDPGNPGLYFPRGLHEKDVTLQVGLLLRDELRRRGVKVVMTRTTDTLINLFDRAAYCTDECDLFVSLHVDALDPRRRAHVSDISGFHTIIIGEENTEDADRIARMENDALRYEDQPAAKSGDDLDFILRNLQMNEYLREAARAAELVQADIDQVHTGEDRGVKQSNRLVVLNTARRPAILIEMGFSTNPGDARLLTHRKSQAALASAIADAVVSYLLEYERKAGLARAGG
ncbi:MAG TPA: N-acetylmuramoyl-L-alanine amidase [Gemmatimonadales bacterium]|nr:N-acetylmuramoyl-L-alanine amidase [Gemmatimonadales bacterium]